MRFDSCWLTRANPYLPSYANSSQLSRSSSKTIIDLFRIADTTLQKKLATFPSPAGMSLTKLPLGGLILIFPPRESLVSDIPAGDGNVGNFFYSVVSQNIKHGVFLSRFGYPPLCVEPINPYQYELVVKYDLQNSKLLSEFSQACEKLEHIFYI
jgi:hypothetical protein